MWMSGYSARTRPADGKIHDLWAKALVLEDPTGGRVVLVTLDLVGIDRELSRAIRDAVRQRFALGYDRCALLCSHTHSGPVVGRNLLAMYFLDAHQDQLVRDYTSQLREKIVRLVGDAIGALRQPNSPGAWAAPRSRSTAGTIPRRMCRGCWPNKRFAVPAITTFQ